MEVHQGMRRANLDIWGLLALLLLSLEIRGVAPALLTLFFIPGYFVVALAYPTHQELPLRVRLAASIGLSPIVVGGAALLHSYLVAGRYPPTFSVVGIGIVLGMGAALRRANSPGDAVALRLPQIAFAPLGLLQASLLIALVLVIAQRILAAEQVQPAYTEFYVLGTNGRAAEYPVEIRSGDPLTLTVGVVNHEGATRAYSIAALQSGKPVGVLMPFQVADGGRMELPLTIDVVPGEGVQRIDIWLGGEGFEFPYRELTIWLEIVSE